MQRLDHSFDLDWVVIILLFDVKGGGNVPLVLVGNKSDLATDRKVGSEEAEELAQTFGCSYVETSAKDGTNSEQMFIQLVRQIMMMRSSGPANKGQKKNGA